MIICQGKSVYSGIAIGKAFVYQKDNKIVKRKKVEDSEGEIKRYRNVREKADLELERLYEKAEGEVGKLNAAVFDIHRMMLRDEDYNEYIENLIRTESINAEYAVASAGDHFSNLFKNMDDEYMKERAADVKDISERVIMLLGKKKGNLNVIKEPSVIFAEDLTPSETVQLDKSLVLSFVTRKGSSNSHTAILAKSMGIPAVIGADVNLEKIYDKEVIVDGYAGVVYIDPDERLLEEKARILKRDEEKKRLLQKLKGKDNVTVDGKKVLVYANIANSDDLPNVLENDAQGIGLFRSEFIYMGREDYPSEDEQFLIYKQVAQTMADKKVIIRTLDIGADKQVPYFGLEHEENPAMGLRAIRLCLSRPELLKTQLKAIYRAASFGNISVMYPMITAAEELDAVRDIEEEAAAELSKKGEKYSVPEKGIMIETPAAVVISDILAKKVDFFSIGTNDLIQYTMAADRQNPKLDNVYLNYKLPVMRMIEQVVVNAHKYNTWVGICGEIGADYSLTEDFLRMGVDELSVSPSKILELRKVITEIDLSKKSNS